jgi:hypothetical protein
MARERYTFSRNMSVESKFSMGQHYETAITVDKSRETAHQTRLRFVVSRQLNGPAAYMTTFLEWRETVGAACVMLPHSSASLLKYVATGIMLTSEKNSWK